MAGESGTNRTGVKYRHYKCVGVKYHYGCDKKTIKKERIEDFIIDRIMRIVNDPTAIDEIIKNVLAFQEKGNRVLPTLEAELADIEKRKANLLNAIEMGIVNATTKRRLDELEMQHNELLVEIAREQMEINLVDENKLRFYLEQFKGIDSTKLVNRRKLINTFVNPIYLYDDKLDLILNYQDGTETISLSEVEAFASSSPVTSEGEPGLGKTLLAKCFIDECGLKSYTLRSNKGGDKFVDEITATFEKAKQNAPSIIFLDDMDKYANDDDMHCDAQEYVAVQAGIDFVKGSDVFVIATTNDINKLPDSLVRTGRFDRVIIVQEPTQEDASKIIEHYLKNKKLSDDVDFNDLCKMMSYHSCSDLETLLNEAAIRAGYGKKDCIEMEDLINAVLRLQYKSPDELLQKDKDEIRKTAIHEAGHIVVSEVLNSESVGLASVRSKGRSRIGGFIHKCKDDESLQNQVMICLAGKIATEMYYSDTCASGCLSDFKSAINMIRDGLTEEGTNGVSFLEFKNYCYNLSSRAWDNREAVVHAELERYILQTRDVLIKNKEFLEKTADALVEKETLLYSDIQSIKNSVTITKCVA